jgi:thioredoxin-like negative regulator of GroEL
MQDNQADRWEVFPMRIVRSREELKELEHASEMLLLYFGSETCGVCRDMQPKLEALLAKYPEIVPVKIPVESKPEIAASYQIFSIPAIILLIQGRETVHEAGIISLRNLEQQINRYDSLLFDRKT